VSFTNCAPLLKRNHYKEGVLRRYIMIYSCFNPSTFEKFNLDSDYIYIERWYLTGGSRYIFNIQKKLSYLSIAGHQLYEANIINLTLI